MKKYENYASALRSLRKAPQQDLSNEFVQSGVIDKFELQFERVESGLTQRYGDMLTS